MSLAVLELNDQSLLIQAEGGALYAESGFARLTGDGILTGETARASAWREPQHSYNQYWCHLNQADLPGKQQWARHHADIAYAQLNHLWQGAGAPESLILLVPGSFNDAQLSLVMGMVGALPCQLFAVVDNALAACLEIRRETLFVDMQLHQCVLTVCRPDTSAGRQVISIVDQEVFPGLGMMQVLNSVARHISNMLIDSARYDPLHASASEQSIFDQLTGWLTRLRWEGEVSAELETDKGELPFILRHDVVKKLLADRLDSIRSFLARHPGANPMLSHSSALLSGLSDEFESANIYSYESAVENTLAHYALLPEATENLYRIRSLELGETGAGPVPLPEHLATHVLYADQALPLSTPVSISLGEDSLELANKVDKNAALTVVLRNRSLEAVHSAQGTETSLPRNCKPGESIVVAGYRLRLIEVRDA